MPFNKFIIHKVWVSITLATMAWGSLTILYKFGYLNLKGTSPTQVSSQKRIVLPSEDRSIRGPVDGHSGLWWMIDNVVWTDSWPSIVGAGCGLICVGAGEERVRKVYASRGLQGVERQVGLAWGTRCPARSSAGRMVARKARRSREQELVQGSDSWPDAASGVCGGSPQNNRVTWLSHKAKIGGSAGGDGIRVRRKASMPADTWWDRRACIRRTLSAATSWPCDEDKCYMTHLPLRGLYNNLSTRGSVVFCLARRDSYILTLGFPGEPSFWTASHFLAP
jgi:hypothetical protein